MMAQSQPTHNFKRARLLPSAMLDALDNNILVYCASYLDVYELVQLGRTSTRFGIPQAGQGRSLVNEAAHQLFRQTATDEEMGCVPKYGDESDIGLYQALESLRRPLCFDELAGNGFGPQEHPARLTHIDCGGRSTAMSGHVMRGGRHFVEFAITIDDICGVHLGVIRPVSLTNGIDLEADWKGSVYPMTVSSTFRPAVAEKLRSQRAAKWGDSNIHCCVYSCLSGKRIWTNWDNQYTMTIMLLIGKGVRDWEEVVQLGCC